MLHHILYTSFLEEASELREDAVVEKDLIEEDFPSPEVWEEGRTGVSGTASTSKECVI